jgi:hypothetical protein
MKSLMLTGVYKIDNGGGERSYLIRVGLRVGIGFLRTYVDAICGALAGCAALF